MSRIPACNLSIRNSIYFKKNALRLIPHPNGLDNNTPSSFLFPRSSCGGETLRNMVNHKEISDPAKIHQGQLPFFERHYGFPIPLSS
ncbi:hypothetical protein AVEN_163223-1 [Araneus ventricosus]|uniref:Uncharacterized protein n=1 Tax=Araneus ventricosus TaxID=182803 RepID=A0A4Y2Q810_ARAVE|nr:hypothetical protein AVEN_163223-1 [Araneus ventricosus]